MNRRIIKYQKSKNLKISKRQETMGTRLVSTMPKMLIIILNKNLFFCNENLFFEFCYTWAAIFNLIWTGVNLLCLANYSTLVLKLQYFR